MKNKRILLLAALTVTLLIFKTPILAASPTPTPSIAPTPASNTIMKPYLQAMSNNDIYINIDSYSKEPVIIKYGITTDYNLTAKDETIIKTDGNTYLHTIKMPKLPMATVYHYKAVQGKAETGDYNFTTAYLPGNSFRFGWFADNRTNTDIFEKTLAKIKADNPRFLVIGGDIGLKPNYITLQEEFFRPSLMDIISKRPFYFAMGNHEEPGDDGIPLTMVKEYDSLENDGAYSFDFGDMHVLVINSEKSRAEGSKQYEFVKKDLEQTKQVWKLVVFHISGYVNGGNHMPSESTINLEKKLFETNGVDIVITGNSHFYQRNLVNNVQYMVVGSAGAPLVDPVYGENTVYTKKSYCYGMADVSKDKFIMEIKDENGKTIDYLSLKKNEKPPISVVLDGDIVKFDVAPSIINDRTMVPMRAIYSALNADVAWDDKTKTVLGKKDNVTVKLIIGDNTAYVNEKQVKLDSPAVIIDGRTLVPLRFIAQSLGAKVSWNALTRAAVLTTPKYNIKNEPIAIKSYVYTYEKIERSLNKESFSFIKKGIALKDIVKKLGNNNGYIKLENLKPFYDLDNRTILVLSFTDAKDYTNLSSAYIEDGNGNKQPLNID